MIRRHRLKLFSPLLAVLFTAAGLEAAPIVVETELLTPEQQREKFHLPDGFEIQLVAAEPEIGQPMNLSFDAQGRLWVTHSLEYPFPVRGEGVQPRDMKEDQITDHPARDRISYLEGIGADGKAAKITHFAGGLNIPIGQYPLPVSSDGLATLVYSIPTLSLYRDTNGDGVSDESQVVFKGFGNVDTHGMFNSFTRGFDGWIYACHGFRNTTKIPLPGGGELVMNSGNTVRFKPDGSAIEQFTWGQVNPFGMAFDRWGNLYNADCHSYPITLLLRGAYYESFGKPHDGLGYGPVMIDHNHGSTGICGVAWYDAPQFPGDYRDNLYICNPVNGQVHRDKLVWTGSSPKADSQPEFVTCDDGWFRPVDVKLGPDGALYIADFHNAVIGHYEAPLQHPRRDRETGRIWRVIYTGAKNSDSKASATPDLAKASEEELLNELGNENFATRMMATQVLVDRVLPPIPSEETVKRPDASGLLSQLEQLALKAGSGEPNARVHAAWAWDRIRRGTGNQDVSLLEKLADDKSALLRTHVARILGEQPGENSEEAATLLRLLKDEDGRVCRASAEAMARHPSPKQIRPLLDALSAANPADTHLVHAIRIALREHLRKSADEAEGFASWGPERERILAEVAMAVHPSPPALASWLQNLLNRTWKDTSISAEDRRNWLKHSARYSDDPSLPHLVTNAREAAGDSLANQLVFLKAIAEGRQAASAALPSELRDWGEAVATGLLAEEAERASGWSYRPLSGQAVQENPFAIQTRPSQDGQQSEFFCTLPKGEQRTGIYRSGPFTIPAELTFWMAGHDGSPDQPLLQNNKVRLLDAETGEVLQETAPPRNDMAQVINWSFVKPGRKGVLEITDGDTGGAYAWLAVGRFSIPELNPDQVAPGESAVALVRDLHLEGMAPKLSEIIADSSKGAARLKAAQALVALRPDARTAAVLAWLSSAPVASDAAVDEAFHVVVSRDSSELDRVILDIINRATTDAQKQMAETLASDAAGGELLLKLAAEGRVPARLLQQQPLLERLQALKLKDFDQRVEEITSSLPPLDEQINQAIAARRSGFDSATASADRGHVAFTKRCAVCHQVGAEGNKIGPQLDGIGVRGLDRLLEDILDPNRNVDAAFRSSTIALVDGQIVTGLKRREEGDALILANQEGKEFRVVASEIEESKLSPLSLMPANFAEQVPPEELNDLLAWLLTQKQQVAKP